MKLSTYLGLPESPDAAYDFHTFRKQLVAWGLQVNYDESADANYIVKQKVEDIEFRKRLNFAIKSGVSKKILNLNGVIVNRNTNEIVCFGYETSSEVVSAVDLLKQRNGEYTKKTLTEEEALALLPKGLRTFPYITPNDLAALSNDDVREYQQMYDGVMIRIYYDHDAEKWRVGTGRATDASKSIWSCGKSFYDLFMNTGYWQKIMDSPALNKTHCYMFVMCHPESQQVHLHPFVRMNHVFTRSMETMEEIDVDLGFPKMPQFTGVIERPIDALALMKDSTDTNAGIMIILKNGTRIPIMSHEYNCILRLRGNYANLRCRVIELVQHGTNGMEEAFVKNYPNFKKYFEGVKKAYVEMIRGLFDKTLHFKLRKNRLLPGSMSPEEVTMMNAIWYKYIRERQAAQEAAATTAAAALQQTTPQSAPSKPKKFTIEHVRDYVVRMPTHKLWELLNEKPETPHVEDWSA